MLRTSRQRIVFVGGLHRSGTTLLAKLLASHSEVGSFENANVIENEGQFLQSIMPLDPTFGGGGRFAFHPNFQRIDPALSVEAIRQQLLASWQPYWPADRRWVVEKTPGNLVRAAFLKKVFPDAAFVFITRHPVAVSLAIQKWSHTGIFALLMHWLTGHGYLQKNIRDGFECVVLSYEDLVRKPEETLHLAWRHLGLTGEPLPERKIDDSNPQYFSRWKQYYCDEETIERRRGCSKKNCVFKPLQSIIYKNKVALKKIALRAGFQVSITANEVADGIAAFESPVNSYGYSLLDLERYPISRIVSAAHPSLYPAAKDAEIIETLIRSRSGQGK